MDEVGKQATVNNVTIPAPFARAMREVYGEAGEAWARSLPRLVDDYAARWSLTVLPPFAPLTYNYVAPVVRADGSEAVLKLGVPNRELACEPVALRLFNGRGSVRLIEAEPERGALLLERLRPGAALETIADDEAATTAAALVMRELRVAAPPDSPLPTVETWSRGLSRLRERFNGATGPLSEQLVERAERLFAELFASSASPLVLHGDLHHGNILSATRLPWLAIDPKGVIGEPAYETGALLRNPLPGLLHRPNLARVLARRVDQLAEILELDTERIAGWAIYQAVLSAAWSIEDHGAGWEPAMECARLLATVRR